MYSKLFTSFNDGHLAVIGFLLFLFTFIGALVWTLFIQEKEFYDRLSRIPLKEGENNGGQ